MMLKVWKWYQNCLAVHPVKTQAISSAILWGDSDAKFTINWNRLAVTSMFGFGFVGPVGHFWNEGLDKHIKFKLQLMSKSVRSVATKVAMNGIIFGPFHLLEDLKRNYVPLILEGGVWPVVLVFNFRCVPVKCFLDSAFLSCLEQQKGAPLKKWFASFHSTITNEKGGGH
ncbi:hypothetical protein GLYMA_08G038300v4 [Glycine max]|uniref:PXMP2/4 family protein 2 n=2 Tax=Glycine subgen. Soja TaxID=1462606 RepID=K7L4T6_SOYBN|nr:hypothetical protein GYH30_020164 [Glycine max]KRH41573.1 hypothetical protein GLYMA_08G038300v4 [Glycine max]RZB95139.1 hypothetical protein D0Y65_019539 [Glycine soja]